MKYIFPKQFGLHNVFASTVDPKETAQPFKDYTLREQEIAHYEQGRKRKMDVIAKPVFIIHRLPKRLRGETFALVRKLQIQHARCSYHQLLKYYCPLQVNCLNLLRHRKVLIPSGNGKATKSRCTDAARCQFIWNSGQDTTVNVDCYNR